MDLAGLQSTAESLFPSLKAIGPTEAEIKDGENRMQSGRVVQPTGYHTAVFDSQVEKDRKAYAKLVLDLYRRGQMRTASILCNERQVLTRKDGSTGWFNYLEWIEFGKDDPTAEK